MDSPISPQQRRLAVAYQLFTEQLAADFTLNGRSAENLQMSTDRMKRVALIRQDRIEVLGHLFGSLDGLRPLKVKTDEMLDSLERIVAALAEYAKDFTNEPHFQAMVVRVGEIYGEFAEAKKA